MENFLIHAVGGVGAAGFKAQIEVDGSAYQSVGQAFAHFHFLLFGEEGALDIDVGALAVEAADFYRELAALELGFGFAVAGHGLDHGRFLFFAVQR